MSRAASASRCRQESSTCGKTIAPITPTIRRIPTEIMLSVEDGMPQDCAINCDHLQTVPKRKIGRLVAVLPEEKRRQIAPVILFALGLDDYLKPEE